MNINKSSCLATLLALAFLGSFSTPAQTRKTIAIGTVQTTPSLAQDMARRGKTIEFNRVVESLDRHYINALVQTRKFRLVGRSDLKDLLKEQDLGDSGIVDAGTAAEKGKVKGAEYRVVTTVDSFLEENTDAVFATGRKFTKRRFQLSAQSIIYDSSTSEVVDSSNFQVEKLDTLAVVDGQVSDAKRTDELMPALVRELSEKVAARTVDVIYPVKVLDKEGKVVTINRGDGFGIKVGEIWNVYGPSKTITDPDTGAVIKRKGVLIGQVKISSIDTDYSQAEILGDKDVPVGSIVSRPQEVGAPRN